MKKSKFLNELYNKEKLNLVEPSNEICQSYINKSKNCLTSAKLLFENKLYENSISMFYYAMYNSLTALLFKIGIKSENHSGSILLLRSLINQEDLFKILSNAKKERIDKQYYVTAEKDELTKEISEELLEHAEDFILNIKIIISKITNESVEDMRKRFKELISCDEKK